MSRGRVGEERGGKETDRCPLTHSHKAVNIAMSYAHSHEAVTTYTAFLESDESPTSTMCLSPQMLQMDSEVQRFLN
jgi:hypothetical protein